MIFAAGFNLKKKAFVKNMSYISMFGILGTFVFFIVIVLLLQWANQLSKF
jgi:NhaP-type Na+/H+ or K+/H+ antiporter